MLRLKFEFWNSEGLWRQGEVYLFSWLARYKRPRVPSSILFDADSEAAKMPTPIPRVAKSHFYGIQCVAYRKTALRVVNVVKLPNKRGQPGALGLLERRTSS
eukprot:450755-Pelagomonas_calceolata.AAC.16